MTGKLGAGVTDVAKLQIHTNRFGLQIVFQYGGAHLAAPTRLLVTAKGQRSVKNAVTIHPNRPRFDLPRELVSF